MLSCTVLNVFLHRVGGDGDGHDDGHDDDDGDDDDDE